MIENMVNQQNKTTTKIHKIYFSHYGAKSEKEGIECYCLADDEDTIYDYIDKNFMLEGWTEKNQTELVSVYDEEGDIIGEELYKDKVLRERGNLWEEIDDSHVYYGVTQYGWTEGIEVDELAILLLTPLISLVDIRTKKEQINRHILYHKSNLNKQDEIGNLLITMSNPIEHNQTESFSLNNTSTDEEKEIFLRKLKDLIG